MIYIAQPYSHHNPTVRYKRFLAGREYANRLMKEGKVCFNSIAYGYQFERMFDHGSDFETWRNFNIHILRTCNEIHVLMMPGWKKSKGLSKEVRFAQANNTKEFYIRMDSI